MDDLERQPAGEGSDAFPAYNSTFAADAYGELARFFDAIAFDQQGSFQDLLTSPLGFVTRVTAPTYGLDGSRYGAGLTAVTLDAAQRPGFLSRIAFLTATSGSSGNVPFRRGGYLIRNGARGRAAMAAPPERFRPRSAAGGFPTNRAYVEAYTSSADCAPCHATQVDAADFVFEAYDAIGAWRTTEATTGAPIDTSVNMLIDGVSVALAGPADLMAHLKDSADAQRAYARRLVSYAYEREADPLDAGMVDALAARIADEVAR